MSRKNCKPMEREAGCDSGADDDRQTPPAPITQGELVAFSDERAQLQRLRERHAAHADALVTRYETGAPVAPGTFGLRVEWREVQPLTWAALSEILGAAEVRDLRQRVDSWEQSRVTVVRVGRPRPLLSADPFDDSDDDHRVWE